MEGCRAAPVQANVNPTLPVKEWPLDALAAKMAQYCVLMADLTPELLLAESGGDYEALRAYLRRRGVEAYWKKARTLHPCLPSYSSAASLALGALLHEHHMFPDWIVGCWQGLRAILQTQCPSSEVKGVLSCMWGRWRRWRRWRRGCLRTHSASSCSRRPTTCGRSTCRRGPGACSCAALTAAAVH
jgi:hypothetical protein